MNKSNRENSKQSRGMSFDAVTLNLLDQIAELETGGNQSLANRKAIHFYAKSFGITPPTLRNKKRRTAQQPASASN